MERIGWTNDAAAAPVQPRLAPQWLAPACRFVLPLLPLSVVVIRVLRDPLRIHNDCAMYLQCGQLLLEGQLPYVDFIDVNLPLVMYLNVIPAFLARFFSVNAIPIFSLSVALLAAWSVTAVRAQLGRLWPASRSAGPVMLATLWAGFSLAVWELGEFGQREHLFVLLYLPFFIARVACWSDPEAGAAGRPALAIPAALGMCLKPHFTALVLAPELWALATTRRLAPLCQRDVGAFLATALLYVAHFAVLPAAERTALFGRWLPLLWHGYDVYNVPRAWMLHQTVIFCSAAGACGVLLTARIRATRRAPLRTMLGMLSIFDLASVGLQLAQSKGWFYHELPAIGSTAMLLGVALLAVPDGLASPLHRLWVRRTARAIAFFIPVALLFHLVRDAMAQRPLDARFATNPFKSAINAHTQPGDPVLFISTSNVPAYPTLAEVDRRPGSRYLFLFPVAVFARRAPKPYPSFTEMPPDEQRVVSELADDIATRHPPLIFVNDGGFCHGCPPGFNLLQYFENAGLLDTIRRDYQRTNNIFNFAVFIARERSH